ncbi:MAG: AraC family transcriptional regulator [Lachnospiraceae bacterium]|nr:AraC family transcriptional regulator [Lachnospiraceae bacterium]
MEHFILDGQYGKILNHFGIEVGEALRKAGVAEDVFSRENPSMTENEYYDFMSAVGNLVPSSDTAIQIVSVDQIESFSPPIFACFCSKNGMNCIERLAKYKNLIGPLKFNINNNDEIVSIEMTGSNSESVLPLFLVEAEMAFLIQIIRKATKEEIVPVDVMMTTIPNDNSFAEFAGSEITKGNTNVICFQRSDLFVPFISRNDSMWNYFEPELSKRLSELEMDDSFSARVRSALTELLPSGYSSIEEVAEKLGTSKRTLQRKLQDEDTNFQKQLNHVRKLLALNYLKHDNMTSNDIAYLLGYQELNSFLRAFNSWTGMSISEYKMKE